MNRFVLARGGVQRIPLTIVGGPQGAGKTTLLRRLLTHNGGRHIAVVLDHPSALALEGSLIARADANSIILHNGSACLSVDGDIGAALSTLHTRHGSALPNHVVVEASASANPVRTSGYAFLPGFRAGGTIVVVSAPDVLRAQGNDVEFDAMLNAQLQHAELLVLNQVDRVTEAERQIVRRWLLQQTSRARLVESEQCVLPTAIVLGTSLDHAPVHAIHAEWTPSFAIDSELRRFRIVQPRHEDDYRAWVLTTRESVEASAFRAWVNSLPDNILRGDGVLRIRGEPSHRFQFHRCGLRWSLARDDPWGHDAQEYLSWVSLVGFATASKAESELRDGPTPAGHAALHFRPPLGRSKKSRRAGDVS